MATITERNNPSFVMFPFHTNRTAWRPFGAPMILVVPHTRDRSGRRIEGSEVTKVRIFVNPQGPVPVAGHDNIGVFKPEFDVYVKEIPQIDLGPRIIRSSNFTYLDGPEGSEVSESEATHIRFTCREGIVDSIDYIDHADYYDISDCKLDIEDLVPGRYILTYEATHNLRTISSNNELLCVEATETNARTRFPFAHPGEVIQQMTESTPALYFTDAEKSKDTTIAFYRPLAESLQNIHDEQEFIKNLNWPYDIPAEFIPYLGFLLGWELPYFPQSVDNLRRAVLRNTVKLQKLKGTKRAVRELFDLFGFVIDVANIWWTPNGEQFVAPGEAVVNQDFAIDSDPTATTEPLFADYREDGFGPVTVPLVYRPIDEKLTVRAILVENGSAAYNSLQATTDTLSTNFNALDYVLPDQFNLLPSTAIEAVEDLEGTVGYTEALIGSDGFVTEINTSGRAPVNAKGFKHDYVTGVLSVTYDRHMDFTNDNTSLWIFATYGYNQITVPVSMRDLQSNRFDVTILTTKSGETVDPSVILFLVDFLFKIKAFHSLLRKVIFTLTFDEVYAVQDFCVGGEIQQLLGTDAGNQQVPPEAIIPIEADGDECNALKPEDHGFRPWDIDYRERVLAGLEAEYQAWSNIVGPCDLDVILGGDQEALLNLSPELLPYIGTQAGTIDKSLAKKGQDRIVDSPVEQESTVFDAVRSDFNKERETLYELDGRDYCYKGRVSDVLQQRTDMVLPETWRFKSCGLMAGQGVYYTFPDPAFRDGNPQGEYLGSQVGPVEFSSFYGGLFRSYGRDHKDSLHYSDIKNLDGSKSPFNWLAVRRPSLYIQKDNWNFPGHREPRQDALLTDFTHPTWKLKPWDFAIDCFCPDVDQPNPLNATLSTLSNGEQFLVYDEADYTIEGNGLEPDISSFGEHLVGSGVAISDPDTVTHAIYAEDNGHPAVSLDYTTDSIGITNIANNDTVFNSAAECESGSFDDLSDGYPSVTGYINDPGDIEYFPASSDSADLATGLELGFEAGSGATLLFSYASQIRVAPTDINYDYYRPMRYDCGCLEILCPGETGAGSTPTQFFNDCDVQNYLDTWGNTDPDQLDNTISFVGPEETSISTLLSNGEKTFFEILQLNGEANENGFPGDDPFPPSGNFTFKDDWDTVYQVYWETVGSFLDVIVISKDPRIWGSQTRQGEVINREVFIDGIITTTRHVFEIDTDGNLVVNAEGNEQELGRFQCSYLCNNPFTDPFVYHYNHDLTTEPEAEVVVGPHWTFPGDETDSMAWAGDTGGGTTAGDPMTWVDVFNF